MCGIAGWVDFIQHRTDAERVLRAMTETMAFRGPDAEGVWVDAHAGLGHRRLAVIDLTGGVQPMSVQLEGRGPVVITYSGEVYNYRELRNELRARGHTFLTQSDTEVVLHSYLEWGTHLADHLNGMFGFAIWDSGSRELLLVRDRLGVKPLYYYPTPGGVLFGSEPKAIHAHPDALASVDLDGLREMLANIKTPGHAMFEGMRELRPGHLLRVTQWGVQESCYWQLEATEHHDDLETTIGNVRSLLGDIVERQLIADVPLCTLLSGGLDSSAVTALAARALARHGTGPVHTFAVDFAGNEQDFRPNLAHTSVDTPYAEECARYVGAQHTTLLLDIAELSDPAVRAVIPRANDTPGAILGDGYASLYLLFRAIREHSTVALSGEAADELFGGYAWFHVPELRDAESFPWVFAGLDMVPNLAGILEPDLVAKLDVATYRADHYSSAINAVPQLVGESRVERRIRQISLLNITRFVPFLLDRKDRMSMATGLEVRVPFCDHRLVSYLFNVPWSMKSFDGREKSLLRAAARDLLPATILERRKSAFPTTHDPHYDQALWASFEVIRQDTKAPAYPLLDRTGAQRLTANRADIGYKLQDRAALEFIVQLNSWLTTHKLHLE